MSYPGSYGAGLEEGRSINGGDFVEVHVLGQIQDTGGMYIDISIIGHGAKRKAEVVVVVHKIHRFPFATGNGNLDKSSHGVAKRIFRIVKGDLCLG